MDEKALFKLLGQDSDALEEQIKTLHGGLVDLMANMGKIIPEQDGAFQQLTQNLNNAMFSLRRRRDDVYSFFSGKGKVAARLREHIKLEAWVRESLRPLTMGTSSSLERILTEKLSKFDFCPINIPEAVNATNGLLNEMVAQVRAGNFTTPFAPMPPTVDGMRYFQTGLYGDDGAGTSLTLVLRVGEPECGEMETVFFAVPGNQPTMWHYHPHEDVWLMSDFQVTFPDLPGKLRAEFNKAIAEATRVNEEFDFSYEIDLLNQRSQVLFDNERFLPSTVVMPGTSDQIFLSDVNSSVINCRVSDMNLMFLNTKGHYAQRAGARVMTMIDNTLYSVEASQISKTKQFALIKKANNVFSLLTTAVNEACKKAAATPRYSYSYKPLVARLEQAKSTHE